jgi:hypothetical protein
LRENSTACLSYIAGNQLTRNHTVRMLRYGGSSFENQIKDLKVLASEKKEMRR